MRKADGQLACCGGLPPLVNFSGDAMKQRVLPDVLAGRKIAAAAISEADAGSDVANI